MMKEELDIRKTVVKCFLEPAILCRLKHKPMTGYRIRVILIEEFGVNISPDTIYHAIYSLERKGLLQCLRKKPGRVYSLTEDGWKTTKSIPAKVMEIQRFIKMLLCD